MNTIETAGNIRILEINAHSGAFEKPYDQNTSWFPEHFHEFREEIQHVGADLVIIPDSYNWDRIFNCNRINNPDNIPIVPHVDTVTGQKTYLSQHVYDFERPDLADVMGVPYATVINLVDYRLEGLGHVTSLCILSKIAGTQCEAIRLGNRNALKITLDKDGEKMDIFAVYLDDTKEINRLSQITSLFDYVTPGRQTMIFGDFNCVSPRDITPLTKMAVKFLEKLPMPIRKQFYAIEEKIKPHHQGTVKLLEHLGFQEASEVARHREGGKNTVPTPKLYPKHLSLPPFLAVDKAFITPEIAIERFEVLRAGEFKRISDHYGVVVEIKKKKIRGTGFHLDKRH